MSPSFETLLILGIAGFYLYDLSMLVYFSEVMVTRSFRRWAYTAPADRWMIRGKILFMPNPLNPAQLIFRFDLLPGEGATAPHELEALALFAKELLGIRVFVLILFSLLCVFLPVIIVLRLHGLALIALLLGIYLSILGMLILLFRKRAALKLSRKECWGLAFEALACPPFAINLARKLSLRYAVCCPLLGFASHYFEAAVYKNLRRTIKAKINETLAAEESDSLRYIELTAYKDTLEKSA